MQQCQSVIRPSRVFNFIEGPAVYLRPVGAEPDLPLPSARRVNAAEAARADFACSVHRILRWRRKAQILASIVQSIAVDVVYVTTLAFAKDHSMHILAPKPRGFVATTPMHCVEFSPRPRRRNRVPFEMRHQWRVDFIDNRDDATSKGYAHDHEGNPCSAGAVSGRMLTNSSSVSAIL